jgi:hypothetical protein
VEWDITGASADKLTIELKLSFQDQALKQGDYSLEISGTLLPPEALPGEYGLLDFGWDADGETLLNIEQNNAEFDGSRTLFLSRLVNGLGNANKKRLVQAPIGSIEAQLTVK